VEDLAAAGRMAAEHFAERGFRHVGYRGCIPWSDSQLKLSVRKGTVILFR
jgi:hypothetical protein